MRERPAALRDETIANIVAARYDLPLRALEFLPVGNDARSFAFRAMTLRGDPVFIKLRQEPVDNAALALARFLFDLGIHEVVAPLPAADGSLWQPANGYGVILYPYIAGECGMDAGLTLAQWSAFGAVLKQIHTVSLPEVIACALQVEKFSPRWSEMVRRVQGRVLQGGFHRPAEAQMAACWQERSEEIMQIVARSEVIGDALRRNPPAFGLCHADIHTANLLIDPGGGLHMVDWDEPIFAPKERDLMFIVGSEPAEEEAFFSGYGKTDIDLVALAYYRYEWVVQELGDYGSRVFFRPEFGEQSAEESVEMFLELFAPGDVVESAYRAERLLPPQFIICG